MGVARRTPVVSSHRAILRRATRACRLRRRRAALAGLLIGAGHAGPGRGGADLPVEPVRAPRRGRVRRALVRRTRPARLQRAVPAARVAARPARGRGARGARLSVPASKRLARPAYGRQRAMGLGVSRSLPPATCGSGGSRSRSASPGLAAARSPSRAATRPGGALLGRAPPPRARSPGCCLALAALSDALWWRSPRALLVLAALPGVVVALARLLFPEGGYEPFPILSFAATAVVVPRRGPGRSRAGAARCASARSSTSPRASSSCSPRRRWAATSSATACCSPGRCCCARRAAERGRGRVAPPARDSASVVSRRRIAVAF